MIEWSKMYGIAMEMAKVHEVGEKKFCVGHFACCIKTASGNYYTGRSYGFSILAEEDAIRNALDNDDCEFERIIVVDSSGALHAPNGKCINWCKTLNTNPRQLCEGNLYQESV